MQDLHDPASHDGCRGKIVSARVCEVLIVRLSPHSVLAGDVDVQWPCPQEAGLLP